MNNGDILNMDTSTDELIRLRHKLHQHPELSGEEHDTAQLFYEKLKALNPDELYFNLGGGLPQYFQGQSLAQPYCFVQNLMHSPSKKH